MAMTTGTLRQAIERILASLQTEAEHLTSLDGQIGDGDLGITLLKAFRELDRIKDQAISDGRSPGHLVGDGVLGAGHDDQDEGQ